MSTAPETIVFIHGLWMTPRSWEHWATRYQERGHTVIAPAWPGLEVEVEELNRRSVADRGARASTQVIDHYDEFVRGLESPPIIIGHSIGGAITQVLVDRGLGSAAVGIASATVKGVLDLPLSTLKASSPVLANPFNRGKAIPLDEKQFHYAFANTLSQEESDEIYRRYHVPAAASVLFRHRVRQPPPAPDHRGRLRAGRTRSAAPHRLRRGSHRPGDGEPAQRGEVREVERDHRVQGVHGRPHFPGAPGWEEVADYALDWAVEHAGAGLSRARRRATIDDRRRPALGGPPRS